jgi:hypothetical protein
VSVHFAAAVAATEPPTPGVEFPNPVLTST